MTELRLMHTMLRVRDLDASIAFYTDFLGMQLIKKDDFPDGGFTLAFVGYGEEKSNTLIELTYNYGDNEYEIGTAYGHIALETADIHATVDLLKKGGAVFTREPGPMLHGTTEIAFLKDPDGYMIELVQPD
ncbi:putative lactoylglutathione lyase GloA [Octadecabacter antarcticus 307]|uniref:Lactoylglutathione lyase n=1 Tax=Octadecabacter antarcticus 307 TaxID=391626 RepID=M9R8U3_9RHOB|nr:lactoylglutathione lyase [Octadecabacter antarcticus]AGI68637.1 putative lactoylglutathione lyase GloA [Octadecabacter antarcticus 307]